MGVSQFFHTNMTRVFQVHGFWGLTLSALVSADIGQMTSPFLHICLPQVPAPHRHLVPCSLQNCFWCGIISETGSGLLELSHVTMVSLLASTLAPTGEVAWSQALLHCFPEKWVRFPTPHQARPSSRYGFLGLVHVSLSLVAGLDYCPLVCCLRAEFPNWDGRSQLCEGLMA